MNRKQMIQQIEQSYREHTPAQLRTPRTSQSQRGVPKRRPNGQAWLTEELEYLNSWAVQLRQMSKKGRELLEQARGNAKSKQLREEGFEEIMPGMWVKADISPMRTNDAYMYVRQSNNIWDREFPPLRMPPKNNPNSTYYY